MLVSHASDDGACIFLSGDLMFSDHGQFRDIVQRTATKPNGSIKLDLSGLTFIDSAGLGMLLLLREEANKRGQSVILANPANQVARMLEISKFNTLFRME